MTRTNAILKAKRILHLKLIGCEVLAREIYACAAFSPHVADVELLLKGLHETPERLRASLQERILAVDKEYDAVLLAYGLCGRSIAGLTAGRVPLVVPRVHDCITLYLGSRQRYNREFGAVPGTYWYTADYMQRSRDGETVGLGSEDVSRRKYEEFVAKYGKENADYLTEVMGGWRANYSRAVLIHMGLGGDEEAEVQCRAEAEKNGWEFKLIEGDLTLIRKLIAGDWDEDFLIVPPGHRIEETYDEVILDCNGAP